MWYSSPEHEWDVNWFAVGLGQVGASKQLFTKMFKDKDLKGFNRKPSFCKGKESKLNVHDFKLRLKINAQMTSFARSELKIKIKELKKKDYQLVENKWQELIVAQTNLIRDLKTYESKIKWEHELPVRITKTVAALGAVIGAALLFYCPPAGLILSAAAGGAGLSATAAEYGLTAYDASRLGYMFAEVMSVAREFEEIKEEIQRLADLVVEELEVDREVSWMLVFLALSGGGFEEAAVGFQVSEIIGMVRVALQISA